MQNLLLILLVLVVLIRIGIVFKDAMDYKNERRQFPKDNKSNTVFIPISDTAYAHLPESYSHRNFLRKKKESLLRSYNPLAYKFITDDKATWNLSVIQFHGKLIDQYQNPISNADLVLIIRYLTVSGFGGSDTYAYQVDVKTDANGYFSLDKVVGKDFSIDEVWAEGYFFKHRVFVNSHFETSVTSEQKPYLFRGWKRESPVSEDNINVETLRFPKDITPLNDGTPYTAFLSKESDANFVQGDDRDITISVISNNDGNIPREEFETSYEIKLTNGGLFNVTDSDYPYKAPKEKYQSSMKGSFKSNHKNYIGNFTSHEKYYYIALENPKRYGLLYIYVDPDRRDKLHFYAIVRINELGERDLLRKFDLKSHYYKKHYSYEKYHFDYENQNQ